MSISDSILGIIGKDAMSKIINKYGGRIWRIPITVQKLTTRQSVVKLLLAGYTEEQLHTLFPKIPIRKLKRWIKKEMGE